MILKGIAGKNHGKFKKHNRLVPICKHNCGACKIVTLLMGPTLLYSNIEWIKDVMK